VSAAGIGEEKDDVRFTGIGCFDFLHEG